MLVSLALALAAGCGSASEPAPVPSRGEARDPRLSALDRSLDWLRAHPPAPGRDAPGWLTMDALAWYVFSALHPEERIRLEAGRELDRRLLAIPAWDEVTSVSVSYEATLLYLKHRRGLDVSEALAELEITGLAGALSEATPTTRWWTQVLLRRAGVPEAPDPRGTFTAVIGEKGRDGYVAEVKHAYLAFHELIPATDFGREEPLGFAESQVAFLGDVVGEIIEVTRAAGDTDGVAEALVVANLVGRDGSDEYRAGLEWLLSRQRPDGTFDANSIRRPEDPHEYRHVVAVGSWALLASLASGGG